MKKSLATLFAAAIIMMLASCASEAKGVVEISDADIDEKVMNEKGKLIVLDCYADWCTPCKIMAPIFEELSGEYKPSEVRFLKIDTDDNRDIVQRFNIRGIPTLLFFKDGKLLKKHVGLAEKAALKELIESHK